MLQLKLLGGAALTDGSSPLGGAAGHRHSMGLMALLTCAPDRRLSRGKLVGLLWPAIPEKRARNRLNTYVHRLRSELGPDVLLSEGASLRLNPEKVRSDVASFEEVLELERFEAAVEQYGGAFLDGFWIPDSPEFDQWMDRQRDRLGRRHREALRELARSVQEGGDPKSATGWWRKLWREEPLDSGVALRLMEALAASGDRSAALRVADEQTRLLKEELGAEPDEEVQALARRIREPPRTGIPAAVAAAGPEDLDPNVVAILPFENLGGGEEERVFAAGLHHDLLTHLSRSDELTVISRTSVIRYRNGGSSIREIARTLGAGTVVEGGLQHGSGRIRLNVQMVDGRRDEHRWAEIYDRRVTAESLFEIQNELAERIAGSLQAQVLSAGRSARPGSAPTRSLEAYRLQVEGRARLDERTEQGMRSAVEHFRRAIEVDPEYPLAWVGLADGLTLLFEYTGETAERTLPEAEAAARRALELSPELGEAHASMGLLHEARHQGPESLREHRRAVALQPGYAEAHNWLSWTSQLLGRPGEALAASRRAVELNPLSPEVVGNLGITTFLTGDSATGLREVRRAKALQPDQITPTLYEAIVLQRLGRLHEAKDLLRGLSVAWAGSGARSALAVLEAVSGEVEAAREALSRFESEGDAFAAGIVHAALGDRDGALEALAEVERWGPWPTLVMHYDFPQVLGPLRADPRFEAIMTALHRFWGLEPDGSLPGGD